MAFPATQIMSAQTESGLLRLAIARGLLRWEDLDSVSDHLPVVADYQVPAIMQAIAAAIPSSIDLGSTFNLNLSVSDSANSSINANSAGASPDIADCSWLHSGGSAAGTIG